MNLQKRTVSVLVVFLVGIVVAGSIYATKASFSHGKKREKNTYVPKVLAAVVSPRIVTSVPTATPSSAPTLLPTQPVSLYSGYCLAVPVLMYHHIMPYGIAQQKGQTSLNVDNGAFDQQMGYIASHGYTSIFAEDLINALRNHTSLPSKSIVVTMDDGYLDNYTYAFPIVKKYNIKTSLMVPTGLLGVNSGTNSYYSWSDLKDMVGSGLVEADNHTFSHFSMGSKDIGKDQFEVSTAQTQLKENLGKNVIVFAYPYGTNAMSTKEWAVLQQNGLLGAFSTIDGSYQCDSFIYSLHRTRVGSIPFPAFGIN